MSPFSTLLLCRSRLSHHNWIGCWRSMRTLLPTPYIQRNTRHRQFYDYSVQSTSYSRYSTRLLCSTTRNTRQARMQVVLTESEDKLCQLLDNATQWLSEQQPERPRVELRIAGGWVRDKLLGLESHDLDIAIDSMTGYEFAQQLANYQQSIGQSVKSIAKIASNPERSKHLETATSVVLGLSLDFVHLRCEEYQENSRIPNNVTFGTPTQDAYRRDLTINTLFYNVHSRQVEDFTNMGLQDLRDGIVRTPLAPYETFMDDPLRVLRCIRFATRFRFKIDADAYSCMSNASIKTALQKKISRERIGVEIGKMLQDDNSLFALTTLYDTHLYDTIFALPARSSNGEIGDATRILPMARVLSRLLEMRGGKTELFTVDKTERRLLFLAVAVSHYRHVLTTEEGKKTMTSVPYIIVKESLKLPGKEAEQVAALLSTFSLAQQTVKNTEKHNDRVYLGQCIRQIAIDHGAKAHWRLSFIFALVDDLVTKQATESSEFTIIDQYEAWMQIIISLNLQQIHQARYLIDGKEVARLFKITPGPRIRTLLEQYVMPWQLANPQGSADECRLYLQRVSDETATQE